MRIYIKYYNLFRCLDSIFRENSQKQKDPEILFFHYPIYIDTECIT